MPAVVLRVLLSLALCITSLAARAIVLDPAVDTYSLSGNVDVLEDPGGAMTLDEVRKATGFRPAASGRELNFAYSSSAYWLRFSLQAERHADWLLEVAYPTLDQVDFYAPDDTGYRLMRAGDLRPFAERPIEHRNFVFPVRAGNAPATYYLRVASEGSLTVPVTLWRSDAFARHSEIGYAALCLYYGVFIALAAYNLFLYFALHDRLFLNYVAFVTSLAVGLMSQYGIANQFLWPQLTNWGNLAFPVGISLAGLFGAMFTRGFLGTDVHTPRLDRVLRVMIGLFALNTLAFFIGPYRLAGISVSILGASFCVLALVVGIVFQVKGRRGARYFVLAWTLLLTTTAVMALRNLGWLPSNMVTLNGMQIGSMIEMLLLSFALADRYNRLRHEKELAQVEALMAKQSMVDALQRSEQGLEQRVRERTAELERANRQLRDSERMLKDMAHHDALTGLANRVLLDIRLAHAIGRAQRTHELLAVLLIDLDGFKPVNDQFGHAAGDRLLAEIGRRCKRLVRDSDTVARLGGDEFVVLLESAGSIQSVRGVAEKLLEALAQPYEVGTGVPVKVTASIGIAVPGDGATPDELIRRADAAMYQAKSAGGNRVRQQGPGDSNAAGLQVLSKP